ncbi:MAG: HAMP domain-containing histidine kinase, partial [Gemmataceae bacterium]|nr:HAMP domain-containing histidine kinase [Gemmataceae bacterium]
LWEESVWQAVRPTLIIGFAGGTAAISLVLLGTRGVIRRLRELERHTRQIAAGDFRPMASADGPHEIRRLADHVNEMAIKLQHMKEAVASLERDRLLGQVTAGWAHQLRNAATGARLALQIHAHQCSHDRDSLEVAERQLGRIESDLKRFLDWKRGIIHEDVCPAAQLIQETVDLVRPRCRHSGIVLTWNQPVGPQLWVRGDRTQLTHLLLNVVTNALDAAGPAGQVEIALERSSFGVCIDVYDNGPGPPDSIRDRLFEPFVTSKPEGIGLGLAFAAQVAQSHRGRISWTRTADQRTRFRIELPIETQE